MIKLTNVGIFNFEGAIRGMRNPLESWKKSDSNWVDGEYKIGPNDLGLMQRLRSAGSDHAKYLRQIFVSVDITAPLYWFKEFDTYKVGTVANSTSTMHCISKRDITPESFSFDNLNDEEIEQMFNNIVKICEKLRKRYVETKDPKCWRALIQILPNAWMQTRTVTLNYAVLNNMYNSRKAHKLTEWRDFCKWVETLPYAQELITSDPRAYKVPTAPVNEKKDEGVSR